MMRERGRLHWERSVMSSMRCGLFDFNGCMNYYSKEGRGFDSFRDGIATVS
jgi:hypothetical protein